MLLAGRPSNRVSISRREKDFYFLCGVKTCSEAHPATYTVGTGEFLLQGKALEFVILTTHLHLVTRLIIMDLYLLYVFMNVVLFP
jgi:hypothetical protein